MDQTQRFDPHRTVLTGLPNPGDPLAGGGAPLPDPNRTSSMAGLKALSAEIVPSRGATLANGPAREQFLIELTASGSGGARTPLNLCLVIDRSGSMEGPPLDYVKQACAYVVDLLGPDDILSIVTFEEVVDILMPPQRVTNKQPIKDGIARLMPGNTTNLYDGLLVAAQQLQSQESRRATRMVVLSDGDPTAGIKDFPSLVQHAANIKAQGITSTFLGFGPDYNEELLASMAKKSGGNYYYIPQPNLIPEIFRTELEKLMTVVAMNLKLELKLARWVSMRAPEIVGSGEIAIGLSDMERGSVLQKVVDLEFPNHPLGHYRVAGGRLSYDDTITGQRESIELDLAMEFTADAARYGAPVDSRVRQAAEISEASRAVEKTMMGLKTGQVTAMGAIQELQKTQALLRSEGRLAEAHEVTQALQALQSGDTGGAEKTLMGTFVHLDSGKKQG